MVQEINTGSGYRIKTLDNEYFVDKHNEASDNGQELKGYYQNGKLRKMVYSVGFSYGMRTYEYYFDGENLVFVFEKEADYPIKNDGSGLDQSKLIPVFERRFYIDNNKIILTKSKGHQRIPDTDNQKFRTVLKDLLADLKTVERGKGN